MSPIDGGTFSLLNAPGKLDVPARRVNPRLTNDRLRQSAMADSPTCSRNAASIRSLSTQIWEHSLPHSLGCDSTSFPLGIL